MRRAFDNPLMRNFAKLFAGTAAAKMLGFLAMPLIARLVTPEDFGEFSVFTAMVSVIAPLLALRYVDAIPIPKSASRATQLLTLALLLITINATVLLAAAWLLLDVIVNIYPFVDWCFLLLVYFAVVALSIFEALNLWAVRTRNYGVIARTQVSQALAGAISKVVLSYFAIPMGLMLGQVVQNLTGISSLLKTQSAPFQNYRVKVAARLLRGAAKDYSQYPKYRLASQMLLVITQALPVLAVSKIYGQAEAGQLGLAFAVVSAPVMMVVGNVRKLYYGEAANLGVGSPKELYGLTFRVAAKMVCIAIPGCMILFLFGESLFELAFGDRWSLGGRVAELYSMAILGLFVSGAFSDLPNILQRQECYLIINLIRFAGAVMIFMWAHFSEVGYIEVVFGFSIFMCIFYLLSFFYFVSMIDKKAEHEEAPL